MIPLKLQLRNFLSYGPEVQTISFSPYRLLCLSGKNGHGKSALLDAITWAVWGQARKTTGTTKPDIGLLRLGQSHMFAALDFLFNNQQYRVKREFLVASKNKQVSTLDFGLWDATTQTYKPLTKKTTRETQEHIEQILNLDFDSFVNSAFLRQGHANEFSKKSPKERKEILAAILGLNKYDPIRTLAFEKIRQATAHKAQLAALQEKRTIELEAATQVQQELFAVAEALTHHAQQEEKIIQNKATLAIQKNELTERQKDAQIIQFQAEQIQKNIKNVQEKIITLQREWRNTHKKSLNAINPQLLELEKKTITCQLHNEQQKLQTQLELKQRLLQHKEKMQHKAQQIQESQNSIITAQKMRIERASMTLQTVQTALAQLMEQLQTAQHEESRILATITQLKTQIHALQKNTKNYSVQSKQFEKRKEHYQKYIAYGNLLNTELNNLTQKKGLAHDETNPSCPLCEQNLSAARKRFLKQKFDEQERFLTYRMVKIGALIQQLKTVLISQHEELTCTQKNIETLTVLQAQFEHHVQTAEKLALTLTTYKNNLNTIHAQEKELLATHEKEQQKLVLLEQESISALQKNSDYIQLMQEATTLDQDIAAVQYDAHTYQKLLKQIQEIERHISEYETVQKEFALQDQRRKEISSLCSMAKKEKQELNILMIKIRKFNDIQEKEQAIIAQEHAIQVSQTSLTMHKEQLMLKKGSLESQQLALEKIKKEHAEHAARMAHTETQIEDYQLIAQAMSKDGIQALLIEEAIPEIEQAANDILGRLTNNQAHISIESLKDLKKGGTKETLDINISDTAGIRAYELFSGGEAFRIDFALRIAISKLLARRAGTSLQTLIIDEGFGSQDEEGLNNIMNALYAIQDDFSKIIIVSHLPTMKDQFPVHMVVEKGAHGSQVHVFEQG